MQTIYIVEDDDNIREMVEYALTAAGFAVEGFADSDGLHAGLRRAAPSLLLLDIMLPGEDGVSILKRLRQTTAHAGIPIIMLTAKGTELDRIRGLDWGADDYITKPFSIAEVISRIRAVLRRYEGAPKEPAALSAGGIVLHPDRRVVMAGEDEVRLTYKEFELLHCLLRNAGIVMTRDRLLELVWGYDYGGESRTVDMHVKSLRQKLGAHGEAIVTVRSVGYKMETDK